MGSYHYFVGERGGVDGGYAVSGNYSGDERRL